jgi:hypothetical protein
MPKQLNCLSEWEYSSDIHAIATATSSNRTHMTAIDDSGVALWRLDPNAMVEPEPP